MEDKVLKILSTIKNLVEDVNSNGGNILDTLDFKYDQEEGVGIITTTDLPAGTAIITIPYSLCLSVDMISCDPKLLKVIKENPGLKDHPDEILALGIMFAMNPSNQCEWSTHVQTFPESLNSTIFWSNEELSELKYCNVFHLTNLMTKQIQNDWDNIHFPLTKEYPYLGHHSLDLYKYALSMVYSRAIGITRSGQYIRCIPPIIDMANHSFEVGHDSSSTFDYIDAENAIQFYNTIPRTAGDQCFASYGYYSNAKLVHTYGFVLLDNPVKTIDLWSRLSPTTPFKEWKERILSSHPLTRNQTYDFVGTLRQDGYISSSLLTTIRIIQANEQELMIFDNRSKSLDLQLPGKKMLSVRNELVTYISLKELIMSKIHAEEAEEDRKCLGEMLLNNIPCSNRKYMALVIRVEERTLYQETLQVIDELVTSLNSLGEKYVPLDEEIITSFSEEILKNSSVEAEKSLNNETLETLSKQPVLSAVVNTQQNEPVTSTSSSSIAPSIVTAPTNKSQVFKAPDGSLFATKAQWRDYMMLNYYSFTNKKKEVSPLIKYSGDVSGQNFNISNCEGCTLVVMDNTEQVQIDDVKKCRIFIGACASSIFIRNCTECVFYVCCRQLRLREVQKTDLYVYSMSEVHIELSNNLRFAPFSGGYPNHLTHLKNSNLDLNKNLWYDIFDHNDPDKHKKNWSLLPENEYESPWYPNGVACDDVTPKQKLNEINQLLQSNSLQSFAIYPPLPKN